MDNTINEKIEELKNIKNTLKETINNKKDNNIDSDDFITNTNTFDSYASVINDKLTRILPTVKINVNSDNSVMGVVNINGLGKTVSKNFIYNDKCTINAISKDNSYEFVSWDDGNTNSCRTIDINSLYTSNISEKTYIATFQEVITPDNPDTPDTPDEDDTLEDPWYFWTGSDIDNDITNNLNNVYEEGGIKDINYVYNNTINQYNIFMIPSYTSIDITLKTSDEYITLLMKQDFEVITYEKYEKLYNALPTDLVSLGYKFYILSFSVSVLSDNSELIIKCVEDK